MYVVHQTQEQWNFILSSRQVNNPRWRPLRKPSSAVAWSATFHFTIRHYQSKAFQVNINLQIIPFIYFFGFVIIVSLHSLSFVMI